MQTAKGKAEALGRKAKVEFSSKDLRSVGNYTLGRLIGKGSFGKVYLATHKLTNGSKVVLKSANKDDTNLAREIHHHRQFVHPHIARLYEVVVTEKLVWMVLEYCPGDELYNYLLQHGKLSVDKVQRIFAQLVGAVCYVHRQSCVHRDLKLENILLDKHENVKLCDFGFTREYEGKANYLQTFCGTICYSAPEMLKGEKYAGEKVDVWSLGVILYALLCGELPFDDDDEQVTRRKILGEEPDYPDTLPADALSLLKILLSKRPLIRPSLPDILAHPFLAEYAPQQQEILKVEQPPPFSTPLEKETLHRMRSAGVDTEAVMESVIAQKCDALAGWWTLLIEKEERKAARRERKRREKEENRTSRRFSQASSRLNALATVEESQYAQFGDQPQRPRGRSERRRSGPYPTLLIPDMPSFPDYARSATEPRSPTEGDIPPPPVDKDSIRGRSTSSSRHRKPIPPPKEGILRSARSRGSTLHLVTTSEVLDLNGTLQLPDDQNQVKKRPSKTKIFWKNWTHWLFESTRRHKNSQKRASQSTPNLAEKAAVQSAKEGKSKDGESPRPQTSKYPAASSPMTAGTAGLPRGVVANGYASKASPALSASSAPFKNSNASVGLSSSLPSSLPPIPHTYTSGSYKRQSLSPSPITPRSTMRRASGTAGLRGRKSTSSSVSSIRSMHHTHHHSHSKASSTSSNNSVSTSVSKSALQASRSPHHSVKVLPATPTTVGFPSNIRYVRDRTGPPLGIGSIGGPSLFANPPSDYGSHDNGRLNAAFLSNGGGGGLSGLNTNTQYYHLPPAPGSPNPFASVNSGGYFAPRAAGTGSPVVGPGGHGGVMFAKRKKNIFKGPMLNFGGSAGGAGASNRQREERSSSGASGSASASHSRSASASGLGRRSGEITIQEEEEPGEEEEEEHSAHGGYGGGGYNSHWGGSRTGAGWGGPGMAGMEEEEEVEEVDSFSPIISGPGEIVEERIIEDGEEEEDDDDDEADESADEGTITDQRSRRSRPRSQDLEEEEEGMDAIGDARSNANPNQTRTRSSAHDEEEEEDNVDVGEGFKGLGYDVGIAITADPHRLSTDGPLSSSTIRVVPEQHQQQQGRGHRRGWSNGGSGGGGSGSGGSNAHGGNHGEGPAASSSTTKVSR
ncbi:hypothetical protein N0V85_004065 [Neurospora sp. IMI 360204]|nr:hypothetical protein N0V85_004065 [Neurospora sp. IMI 360204]